MIRTYRPTIYAGQYHYQLQSRQGLVPFQKMLYFVIPPAIWFGGKFNESSSRVDFNLSSQFDMEQLNNPQIPSNKVLIQSGVPIKVDLQSNSDFNYLDKYTFIVSHKRNCPSNTTFYVITFETIN